VRINFFVVLGALSILASSCHSSEQSEVIRPLVPAISCWKYHLKDGSNVPHDHMIRITTQELQRIHSSSSDETDTQSQARERVLLLWAKRYRLTDEEKMQIYQKTIRPGTCELNFFSAK